MNSHRFDRVVGVNKASAQATGHGQLATRPAVNLISDQSDEVAQAGPSGFFGKWGVIALVKTLHFSH